MSRRQQKKPKWVLEGRKQLIYISQPKDGRSKEEIAMERERMLTEVRKIYPEDEVDIIESLIDEDPPEGCNKASLYFLARSLELMSYADFVIFNDNWADARNSSIEKLVCDKYQIKYAMENDLRTGEVTK